MALHLALVGNPFIGDTWLHTEPDPSQRNTAVRLTASRWVCSSVLLSEDWNLLALALHRPSHTVPALLPNKDTRVNECKWFTNTLIQLAEEATVRKESVVSSFLVVRICRTELCSSVNPYKMTLFPVDCRAFASLLDHSPPKIIEFTEISISVLWDTL